MGHFYQQNFLVDTRDADLYDRCRPSALLGMMQEAATMAAMELNVAGFQVRKKYNCVWMVTRNWLELSRPLYWNEQFSIKTWHRGAAGASSYRDFEFIKDGSTIGQGTALWVMVGVEDHKLFRLKDLEEFEGTDGGELNRDLKLRRLVMPEQFDRRSSREMYYSHTDGNGHVNNIHYADFACDALHMEQLGRERFVRALQIDYLNECKAGETIWMDAAAREDKLYARGCGADGSERFDCMLTLGSV